MTIPAGVAVVGLGFAVVQGMIGATLSSANGFELATPQIKSDSLGVRNGVAHSNDTADANVVDGNAATVYAQTGATTTAHKLDLVANTTVPILGGAHIELSSTDPSVGLSGVILNAKDLTTTAGTGAQGAYAASLTDVDLGVAQSANTALTDHDATTTGATGTGTGYTGDGFSLQSGDATLNQVDVHAYAVHLNGLSLSQLGLSVGLGSDATAVIPAY